MKKRHFVQLWCAILVFSIMVVMVPDGPVKAAGANSSPILLTNLQKDVSQWQVYQDGGVVGSSLANVTSPSLDGKTLDIGLLGGRAYTGLHAYRNMPQISGNASQFTLVLSFFFPSLAHIQALEFTMNTWVKNRRWEWAVQWQHYGDGSPEQGNPPNWRVWTGKNWQNMGLPQTLAPDMWHRVRLDGNIVGGKVHYTFFRSDTLFVPLDKTFAPVLSPGSKLAVGVQLDGDNQERPYDVYIDKMSLFMI